MSSDALRNGAPVMAGVSLALLSCAPSLPPTPATAESPPRSAIAEPPARLPSEASAQRPTVAERVAKGDAMLAQSAPRGDAMLAQSARRQYPPIPPGKDYSAGYPQLIPAPKPRADGSLQSFNALDTGPYLANSNVHTLNWTNDSGRQLAIYKAYLWTGVDKGGVGDVTIEVRRSSDNSYIALQQWDHYADPTVPQHGQQFDYPSPMMLDPGDTMTITHFGIGFGGPAGFRAHHFLILWVK